MHVGVYAEANMPLGFEPRRMQKLLLADSLIQSSCATRVDSDVLGAKLW